MIRTLIEWERYVSKQGITEDLINILADWQEDREKIMQEFKALLQKKKLATNALSAIGLIIIGLNKPESLK
jgi:uncharacterized membrane protein YukC